MAHPVKHLVIHGVVQGVGFRYSMYYAAQRLGVTGWVRNRRDGAVEAIAQGTPAQLESFIEWARKGPAGAHVERVDVTEGVGEFSEFRIEETV